MKISKSISARTSTLLAKFRTNVFTREEAIQILNLEYKDNESYVDKILHEMKNADLIETLEVDEKDARKKGYRIKLVSNEKMGKDRLLSLLKKAADIIRTRVDYDFILVLLFLKHVSDKWEIEYEKVKEELIKQGYDENIAKEEAAFKNYHSFDYDKKLLWNEIRLDVNHLPENLSNALKTLAERNPELRHVVGSADFLRFTSNPENLEILRQLIELFSSEKLGDVDSDILGDAYEWILGYFAPQKAKEGEVYTPREVIRLLCEILDPNPTKGHVSLYDPTSGSGGMLIVGHQYVKEKYGEDALKQLSLYGQEQNAKTYALGHMNVYIHGIRDVHLEMGDTLRYPKFIKNNAVQKFNFVISNPPWNLPGYGEDELKKGDYIKGRFEYGFAPNQSADWIWIQHMLASTDKGKIALVIDNGCLFRGGKEGIIRKKVLEKDFIECVILLPEKLFYNTGAPGAVIIFNKNKPSERKNKVLIINASEQFSKHESVRKLNQLTKENIETITNAYNEFSEEKSFSEIFSIEDIKANDYNLNVTLYVAPIEKYEEIDVNKEWELLEAQDKELVEIKAKVKGYLKELRE